MRSCGICIFLPLLTYGQYISLFISFGNWVLQYLPLGLHTCNLTYSCCHWPTELWQSPGSLSSPGIYPYSSFSCLLLCRGILPSSYLPDIPTNFPSSSYKALPHFFHVFFVDVVLPCSHGSPLPSMAPWASLPSKLLLLI